jgi:uncharacterized protein (TIGR00369 family)
MPERHGSQDREDDRTPDLASVEADIRERMSASPFHRGMGFEVETVRRGEVDLAMSAGAEHANLAGRVHGGVLATLADTAAGLAVRTVIPPGSGHVTVTLDVQFLRSGEPGPLVGRGRVTKAGRRIAFVEAEVVDAGGDVLARAQLTVAIAPPS